MRAEKIAYTKGTSFIELINTKSRHPSLIRRRVAGDRCQEDNRQNLMCP